MTIQAAHSKVPATAERKEEEEDRWKKAAELIPWVSERRAPLPS